MRNIELTGMTCLIKSIKASQSSKKVDTFSSQLISYESFLFSREVDLKLVFFSLTLGFARI